jgi:hypothetical protein
MRFDLHIRAEMREKLTTLAEEMASWEEIPRITKTEAEHFRESIDLIGN